jgi:hypothetical protein
MRSGPHWWKTAAGIYPTSDGAPIKCRCRAAVRFQQRLTSEVGSRLNHQTPAGGAGDRYQPALFGPLHLWMLTPVSAPACNGNGNCENAPGHNKVHGAPGPVVGAGLPVLAIGYGVYWLVKRKRRRSGISND